MLRRFALRSVVHAKGWRDVLNFDNDVVLLSPYEHPPDCDVQLSVPPQVHRSLRPSCLHSHKHDKLC